MKCLVRHRILAPGTQAAAEKLAEKLLLVTKRPEWMATRWSLLLERLEFSLFMYLTLSAARI